MSRSNLVLESCLLGVLIAVSISRAQAQTETNVSERLPLILLGCPSMEYPPAARRAETTGTTHISVLVDPKGHVLDASVSRSSGETREHKMLDRAAAASAIKCRFKPFDGDGEGPRRRALQWVSRLNVNPVPGTAVPATAVAGSQPASAPAITITTVPPPPPPPGSVASMPTIQSPDYARPSWARDEKLRQGVTAYQRGDLIEAARAFEAAYRGFTTSEGDRHQSTLFAMGYLATTYGELGRTADELALNEKLLKLRIETSGERHPDTLTAMNNLAVTYVRLGRTAEQLALAEKVVKLHVETLGEKHQNSLTSVGNLAAAYGAAGRIADQLALSEKVLKLSTEVLGERHPDTLAAMNELVVTYDKLGRTAEQLALAEKALKLMIETHGERHRDTLTSMGNLAQTYGKQGRAVEQLALNERVLRLRIEISGERHPDTLKAMNSLAVTYGAVGRYGDELALAEKAFKLRVASLGEKHPDTLASMNNLASAYGAVGRAAEELMLHERSHKLATGTMGERHPNTLTSMSNLAMAYLVRGRLAEAIKLSDGYVSGAEWQRSQPGLSTENRQSVFRNYAEGYRLFSAMHGLAGQVAEGFRLSELGKARTLLEGMTAQRANRSGVLPPVEEQALEDLNRRVAALDQLAAGASSVEGRQSAYAERNELAREYEALQTLLKAKYPKYAQLSDAQIVGPADLPGLVPGDTVALSYVVNKGVVGVYILGSSGRPRFLPLRTVPYLADAVEILRRAQSSPAELRRSLADSGVRAWRLADGSYRLLKASAPAPKAADESADANEVARYLATTLLVPLSNELKGKTRWIISPDGPLAQLAFETLPYGDAGEPAVASAEIHYTQSLSVYALTRTLQKQYESLRERQSLFAMGNPEYQTRPISPQQRRGLARSVRLRNLHQLRQLDELWDDLPDTEKEVLAVARLFPGSASTNLGSQATEQHLQSLNGKGDLKNYRYLLFSVHGYLSPEQPALSSIVLGLRNRTPEADGYVTASEWPTYDLRSDLTVLSACDTGAGEVVSGEGVMGLPFALFVAGSVNTILTLWQVDDAASAEFVTALFSKLKAGQSATLALRNTKREFLVHPRYSHPRFWAPFILVGAG